MWLRNRRERKAFEKDLAEEVARIALLLADVRAEADSSERHLRRTLRRVPGMRPSCRQCGATVRLTKAKWGRGKSQWSSSWDCTSCRAHHRPDEMRTSFAEDVIGSPPH
jgi:hypothetical protein